MTALAWFLWSALLWCLVLFGYAIVYRPADASISRTFLRVHVAVFTAIVAFELYWFLGIDEYGSKRIPLDKQRRIEHQGFYTGPTGELTFSGRPQGNQFPAPPLDERERISLRPQASGPAASAAASQETGAALPNWTISYRCWRYPFRISGVTRNVNDDWWLAPSDTVEMRAGDDFVLLAARAEERLLGRQKQKLAFRFGTWEGSTRRLHGTEEVVLRSQPIREGLGVGVLLRRAPVDSLGPTGQVPPALLEMADALTLVRERYGDTGSRLGLLVGVYEVTSSRITKNGAELSEPVRELRVESAVAGGTELSYGLGENRFALTIPASITNSPELGPVVLARFATRRWWPLPPALDQQFLITSRQEDSPVDGYWIDVGSGERAFYAKARLRPDLSAVDLNTGSTNETYELDKQFLLGDRVHGAIVALAAARQSIPYTGALSIVLLIAVAIALMLLLPSDDDSPGTRMSVAYVLVWESSVLIVAVRLLLAFRGSLLPPADPRVAVLFDDALKVSLAAFVAIPAALLLPLVARRLLDPVTAGSTTVLAGPPVWIWFLPVVLSIYVLVAYAGGQPSLIMRVNHMVVLVMLLVLAWTARYWTEFERVRARGAFLVVLMLPLVLNMLLLDDKGAYIYLLAFLVVLVLQAAARRERASALLLTAAAVILVFGLTVFPFVATAIGNVLLESRSIGPETKTLFYRLIAQSATETEVMGQEVGSVPVSRQMLLRNVHQNWQMLLYATKGAREPVGFGGAPLTNRGMSYPVILTDALFTQMLLVEHGLWAALGLVAVYVFFAIVCLHAALFLPEGLRHRLFPLAAIAGIVAMSALYMASGNVGMTVFTGLNMPLLGLYSWSDVVLGGAIALIAALLLMWRIRTSYTTPADDRPLLTAMMWTVMAGLMVWFVALGVALLQLRGDNADRHLNDYRLDRQLAKKLQDGFNPSPRRNPCWKRVSGTSKYVLAPGCTPSVLEQIAVEEFNQRADKRDPRGGLIYLDGSRIAINDNYFTVASPFREQNLWTGRILTTETSSDVGFVLLGKPLRLSLAPSGEASSVFLGRAIARRMGRSVLIAERASQPRLCEIARMDNGETWLSSKHVPGWKIFIDGQDVDTQPSDPERTCGRPHSRGCRRLAEGDVIVLERRDRDALQQRHTLLFVGKAPTPVLFTKWVNGRWRHILPHPTLASLGYSIAYAIDRAPTASRPQDLTVGVDPTLHAVLQEAIEQFAATDPSYRRGGPFDGRRIAVAALDASTGEVLALPAWPVIDARAAEFEEIVETTPSGEQYRLLQNPNYANHAIGSTIKPLIFSTVATALAPHVRIEQMVVFNRADAIPPLPPDEVVVHPHTQVGGLTFKDFWDCHSPEERIDARAFLVRSRNYYEAVLGLIGLFRNPGDWNLAIRPAQGQADLEYGANAFTFDVKRVPNYAMTPESPAYARTETMKQSLLFRTLPIMFPVTVDSTPGASYPARCASFLPDVCSDSINLPSPNLIHTVPEPVVLQPQDFQELGQTYIRGFLIGGSLSRWNNVAMAESMARLATGRRIESRLEAWAIGPHPLRPPLPGPLGVTAWRSQNVVEPLIDVVEDEVGRGTAARLAHVVPDTYTVIAKTGTIDEGNRGRESELFAAAIGPRRADEFVLGRTVALFLYMEQSKARLQPMNKFKLAEPILRSVAAFLDQRAGTGTSPPIADPPDGSEVLPGPELAPAPIAAAPTPPPGDASGIEGVLDRALEGVVGINTEEGSGTGFFVQNGCRIVTNHHVIDNATHIEVVTHDGARHTARVLIASEAKDLAILTAPVGGCVGLPLETDRAHRGETIYTIGHPFGLIDSVSRGIVSSPTRHDGRRTVIQIDAAVNPGNSGGPVLNERGRVIGITTYKHRDAERLNFAVAVSELEALRSQVQ